MVSAAKTNQRGAQADLQIGEGDGAEMCRRLQATILEVIPLARAMQLQVIKIDKHSGLHLHAPLAPNVNDKGNAFGGAIGSILILAGWGWMQLANEATGLSRHVVIQRSQGVCEMPCNSDLNVICPAPYESDWERYCLTYQKYRRARLRLQPLLLMADGSVASSMQAEYVATDPEFENHHG